MKVDINGVSITLTPEQLKQINDQVKLQEKEQQSPKWPTTWEECMQKVVDEGGSTYYVGTEGVIQDSRDNSVGKRGNSCLSKRRAEQVQAFIRLSVVLDTLHGGLWVPTIVDEIESYGDEECYFVIEVRDGVVGVSRYSTFIIDNPLPIKTKEIAEHLIEHFSELIKQYLLMD